jgi:hypothetical protein
MGQEIEITGVIRGKKIIELDEETSLLDGSRVRVRLLPDSDLPPRVPPDGDRHAEESLQAIRGMRHMGRSIQRPC